MSGINSLANFGVPGLAGERSAALQPLMTNKFRVLCYNFGSVGEIAPYDMTRQTARISRPGFEFETITMWSYLSAVYVSTRPEWRTMTWVLRDDVMNSAMARVMNQNAKQFNHFDQTSSRAGENYKFEMDLDLLAGGATAGGTNDPNILQKWCFAGCQITGFETGEMNYQDAQALEITLTIRFDNCIGFMQNGIRMGTYSHTGEIAGQIGIGATSAASGGFNLGVSLSGGVNLGGVSVGGGLNIGIGGGGVSIGGGGGISF